MTTDGTAWQRAKQIAADALELPSGERTAFLDHACGDDEALRGLVEQMLPEDLEPEFLESPIDADEVPDPESIGVEIGGYQILRPIGEGGMGRVFAARQKQPKRDVALKVLRFAGLSDELTRRFRWEIEALGRLEHPAIAKIFDAGVEGVEGGFARPWFTMELIDGEPLLDAADAQQLDQRRRIDLFLRICDGVVHAHQRGIIHRDLKPANILVDATGQPHILDFGIARDAEAERDGQTREGLVLGTLQYMSPEQLAGDTRRIDARTDVYALGVMLYRLLTRQPPLDLSGLSIAEAERTLTHHEPRRASSFERSLAGDLDTILATALAPEPERRYRSVDQLAEDLRRSLDDLPIHARRQTTIYQLTKFAKRNRTLVGAAMVLVLALITTSIVVTQSLWRTEEALRIADRERTLAQRARDRSAAAQRFLDAALRSAAPSELGRKASLVDFVRSATEELDEGRDLAEDVRADLGLTLARTWRQIGELDKAKARLTTAIPLFEQVDGETADKTIEARAELCEILTDLGEIDAARREKERVQTAIAERSERPSWMKPRSLELDYYLAEGLESPTTVVDISRRLLTAWSALGEGYLDEIETTKNNLAVALLDTGEPNEALQLLQELADAREARLGRGHPTTLVSLINLSSAWETAGRPEEALRILQNIGATVQERFANAHPSRISFRSAYASALSDVGRYEDASTLFLENARVHFERLGPNNPETLQAQANVAFTWANLKRTADAAKAFEEILTAIEDSDLYAPDAPFRTIVRGNLASMLSDLGRYQEAVPHSEASLQAAVGSFGESALQTLIARNNHAILLMRAGAVDRAVTTASENLELARTGQPGHPINVFPLQMNLGRTLAAAGRFDDAERELLAVFSTLTGDAETPPHQLARIREVLAETYRAAGNDAEARKFESKSGDDRR